MPSETAMLLTQQEWDDVAHMVRHYRMCTQWVEHDYRGLPVDEITRRRLLAKKIIDAVEA